MDLTEVPVPSVVVGFDGGPGSVAAAHEGARQARRRLLPLHLVTAEPSVLAGPVPGGSDGVAAALEVGARGIRHHLERVRDELAATRWAPTVTAESATGRPEQVLAAWAGPEGRVVVGAGGSGTGLGPVAAHLVRSAPCPVLVHRGGGVPDGPVVVGVDCRPGTTELLGAAVDEACVRGVPLVVVHAWGGRGEQGSAPPEHSVAAAEADLLQELVAPVRAGHPGVPVELRLLPGPAPDRLVEVAGSASVLLLGRHPLRPLVPARRTWVRVLGQVAGPVLVVPVGSGPPRPRGVVRARTTTG